MSTDDRDQRAAPSRAFGAGLAAPSSAPSPPAGSRGAPPPPATGVAVGPRGGGGSALEDFLQGEVAAPLIDGAVEDLVRPLVGAFETSAVLGDLKEAMGPAASDRRFSPTASEVLAARGWVSGGGGHGVSPAVAVAIQPSEPFDSFAGRVLCALEAAPRVALVGHAALPRLASSVVDSLIAAGLEVGRVAAFQGADGDALRRIAALHSVGLDVIDFDPVEGAVLDRLRRLRALSSAEAPGAPRTASAGAGEGWFGLGAVSRPPVPILARPRLARALHLGVEAPVGRAARPVRSVALREGDLAEAAEQVVEQAFGRGALGGFASDAVTTVHVRPNLLSTFTACLLETLVEADDDPWFEPPPWVRQDADGAALRDVTAGRRLALDEGATLIHERRLGGGGPVGLIFTNVEPRMKLAGEMSVPGTLSLLRSLDDLEAQ